MTDEKRGRPKGTPNKPSMAIHGKVPDTWGNLPLRADREEEIEWVHQNYVRVVVTSRVTGKTLLRWNLAKTPPPSEGAMRWMLRAASAPNTWDRDVFFKSKSDNQEEMKRERVEQRSIEEIRELIVQFSAIGQSHDAVH